MARKLDAFVGCQVPAEFVIALDMWARDRFIATRSEALRQILREALKDYLPKARELLSQQSSSSQSSRRRRPRLLPF